MKRDEAAFILRVHVGTILEQVLSYVQMIVTGYIHNQEEDRKKERKKEEGERKNRNEKERKERRNDKEKGDQTHTDHMVRKWS